MVGKYKGGRPEIEYTKAMGKKVNYLEGKDPYSAYAADGSHNLRYGLQCPYIRQRSDEE